MSSRLLEHKHEISYLKSRVELASSNSIISLGQRTVFVYAPNAVGTQPPNVYTVWADLLTAIALTRGPITIQFDAAPVPGAITIPGGNLGAHEDIWFTAHPTGGAGTADQILNITAPFTNGFPNRFTNLDLRYSNALASCISVPDAASANASVPTFVFDQLTTISSTGETFIQCNGPVNSCTAQILMQDSARTAGVVEVFGTSGANANIQLRIYDGSEIAANTLRDGLGSSISPIVYSPGALYNPSHAASATGRINAFYNLPSAADTLRAFVSDSTGVPATAFPQTNPATETDIVCAVVTPRTSGQFRVHANIQFASQPTDVVTIRIGTRTRVGTNVALGNATACGTGCSFATANGTITYGGVTVNTTMATLEFTEPAAEQIFNVSWSGVSTALSLNTSQAIVISVQNTLGVASVVHGPVIGNVNAPITAQILVDELSS